jgi:hypothetical protein
MMFKRRHPILPRRALRPSGIAMVVGLFLVLQAAPGAAQVPATRLDAVLPAGGRPGTTFTITLHGADLDDLTELRFSHPGISAKPHLAEPGPFDRPPYGTGPGAVENRFDVTIAADVPAGAHGVRACGRYGLSPARSFFVDPLPVVTGPDPDRSEDEPVVVSQPAIIDGAFNPAGDVDRFLLDAKEGERLTIRVLARQLDSRARPVVSIAAPDGRIVGAARSDGGADAVLPLTFPSAGRYTLEVRDEIHGGGGDHSYRLVLATAPWLASVFPAAGLPGSNDEYLLLGRDLPGGKPSTATLDGGPLEELRLRIPIPADIVGANRFTGRLEPGQFAVDGVGVQVDGPGGPSNPLLLSVAATAPVPEVDGNDAPASAQRLSIPCEVAGRFHPRRDVDWYAFEAKKDDRLWIEVWSHRLGLPVDPALVIQRIEPAAEGETEPKVTVVATVDDSGQTAGMNDMARRYGGREFDQRSFDPALLFTAPADGTYRILVRESRSQVRDDPRLVYRLVVRPPQPDFRLVAVPVDTSGALLMRRGGREMVRVVVARLDGFEGQVTVSAAGLPAGVTAVESVIGPGSSVGYLTLSADAGATPSQSPLTVSGRATVGGQEVTREARQGMALDALPFVQPDGQQGQSVRARLVDRIMVSVSADETAKVTLGLGDGKPIETCRGAIVKIPWTATRQEGATASITGFVLGLPPGMNVPQVAIGGGTAGDFELRPPATVPPGTYSFILAGSMQGLQYARNPDAATKAKAKADAFAAVVTETQAAGQKAQQEAQAAGTALAAAVAETVTLEQARTAAEQAAAQAGTVIAAAEQALVAAMKRAEGAPGDTALQAELEKARLVRDESTVKGKLATEAMVAAVTKHEECVAKRKAAEETKLRAEEASRDAQKLMQAAQQEKQRLDQKAQQMQSQSAPRGINLNTPSPPVTIRIADHPLQVGPLPERIVAKAGGMAEVPFRVERLYGFSGDVNVQCQPPATAVGFPPASVNLPGAMADGKLVVTLPPTAMPGEHRVPLRFTMNFNGQPLSFERPVAFVVEPVPPAPQQ